MILIHPPLDALDVEYALLYRVYGSIDLYLASEYADTGVDPGGSIPEFTSAPTSNTRGYESIGLPDNVTISKEEFDRFITGLGQRYQMVCNAIYPANLDYVN